MRKNSAKVTRFIEGVSERTHFEKGDAAKLNYADNTFYAGVSNFVFHEVKTQPDKQLVVREALRLVKKGRVFAFQDLFGQKKLYGDMNAFVTELKKKVCWKFTISPILTKWILYHRMCALRGCLTVSD